jgi:ATP-binding cassette subfamily B protein
MNIDKNQFELKHREQVYYFLLPLIKRERFWFSLYFLAICFISATPSIDSYLMKGIVDHVENFPESRLGELMEVMFIWTIIYGVWWEFNDGIWRLFDYSYLKFMPKLKASVVDKLYNHVLHHKQEFFQKNMAGDISNRIAEGAYAFENAISLALEEIFRKGLGILIALVTLLIVHPVFTLAMLLWIVTFLGGYIFFSPRINIYSKELSRSRARLFGGIVDSIRNIVSIRIFTNQRYERTHLHNYLDDTIDKDRVRQWFLFKLRIFLGLLTSSFVFCLIYFLIKLRSQDVISVGDFVLVINLSVSVAESVWMLGEQIGELFEYVGTALQSLTLLDSSEQEESFEHDGKEKLKVEEGKIEFRDVSFNYQEDNQVIENQSVTIQARQKIGLVGFSGSGKTTFVSLITRLYEIESGKILIDGQDIYSVSQKSLRENISFVPQEPVLFNRTVFENIAYGKKNASKKEVYEAAKKAYVDDFIAQLSNGYDTLCGEGGCSLSVGQRQRISIARAILKDAPILVLDEATSALDSMTENLIQDSVQNLMKNKTVLVIAHRLSTLLNLDRMIVFDKGSIVEDGTHEELIEANGVYSKLWRTQVGGFLADEKKE